MKIPCFPLTSSYFFESIPEQNKNPLLDRLFRGNYRLLQGEPDMKVDGIKLIRSLGKNYIVEVERCHHITICPAPVIPTDVVKSPGAGSW